MSVKFANNAFGTLSAGISASGTSITLASGQGARFPTLSSGEYFYATLIDTSNNLEVVKCTARSTDVLTVTRAQESTTAQAFVIGDRVELRVTAQGLDDAANPYDKDTSSTGSLALPVGTTAQQPTAADTEGHIRYDSDDSVVYYSNGTDWLKVSSVIATLSSATGNIFAGASSTLTLAGQGFQSSNLVVNFTQSSDSIDEDVSVTPTSDTAATVTVPAAVYNNVTAGNVVSIAVTNSDGIASAAVTKTAVALPSGGTVTTSGGYRVHTFTSSGTFTATAALTADYLVVAGGGGGGFDNGGGGGAGGFRTVTSSSISAAAYAVTVGGGGAYNTTVSQASSGGNSSFNSTTSTGGGGAGSQTFNGRNGGSGGGAGHPNGGAKYGGDGTSGQGNDGGDSLYGSPNYPGGGGGGASTAGGTPGSTTARGGDGGAGLQNNYDGNNYYYAGGGGGSAHNDGNRGGNGGIGGGGGGSATSGAASTGGGSARNSGQGATSGVGGNGGTNTGGGAGGGPHITRGGNGGSGIVIIRYQL